MNFYETTYIVHSALQAGRLDDLSKSVRDKVKSIGGEILFSESWGRKKLAYLIDKQKYGTYIFFQFKLDQSSNKLSDLNQELELNTNILRHLIIKVEADSILEKDEKSEDDQSVKNDEKSEDDQSVENDEKSEDDQSASKK